MTRSRAKFAAGAAAAAAVLGLGLGPGAPAALAQVPAIQSQDVNQAGIVADLVEAKRSDGVLSVKIRLKNTGEKPAHVKIFDSSPQRKVDGFYVQAEGKKYLVLRDSEKVALASTPDSYDGTLSPNIAPGGTFTWWAKYPAPPAQLKKFSFYWPLGAPFDDVPITDK
jgi:hypothetical protein